MEPYVGIAVFELSRLDDPTKSFFREDFYIVHAGTLEEAQKRVEALAQENAGSSVTLRHIVDVAPALYGYVDKDCDLYSRHFASLDDYKRFEMMLGGTDPLAEK